MIRDDDLRNLARILQYSTYAWEPTFDENAFRVVLDSGIITVQKEPREADAVAPGDGSRAVYSLAVLDDKNREIARLVARNDEDAALLKDVWAQAMSAALKPDDVMARIVQELQAARDRPPANKRGS